MNPKYSIIIPTKNRAYVIWRAISSVLSQNFQDIEVLVVDAGSTDDTEKLINEFNDKRIRFVVNPNDTGVASGRNKGIKESRGKYVSYLDSDDFLYPNWLTEMDKAIKKHPGKVLFMPNKKYSIKLVDTNHKPIKTFYEGDIFTNPPFTNENIINLKIQCDTNGMIHTKDSIKKVGFWNETLTLYEDYEFLLRFIEHFPEGLFFVPQVLLAYTRTYGKDSLCSTANYSRLVTNLEQVYKLHGTKKFMKNQTWYPSLRDKYQEMAEVEEKTGKGILERITEKYSLNT